MAERRMFAKTIVTSDEFLDMPATARCLYFTLGMFADDDGVLVIKHWRIHNYIRNDRYHETKYIGHKNSLFLDENKAYTNNIQSAKYTVYGEEIEDVNQVVYQMDTQDRVRLGKDRLELDYNNGSRDNSCPF